MKKAKLNFKGIRQAALNLPPRSRARLAEALLESLDSPERKEIDRLWAHEAEKRIRAYDDGQMKSYSGKKAFTQLSVKKDSRL